MKTACAKTVLALLLFLMTQAASMEAAERAVIRIGGTGGALGGIREVAHAFQKKHPRIEVAIPTSLGSSGGIKALLSDAVDIAVTSRPPTEEERKQGAVELEYARTPFVFITSMHGVADNVTLQQVSAIYYGELKTWPDGTPIRLILRPKGDTDNAYLRGLSAAMDKAVPSTLAREGMVTAVTDQENVDLIQRTRGGFGASTLAQVISEKRNVTVLHLDGVAPDVAALRDGRYPYSKSFFVITTPRTNVAARSFIEFLSSAEGRAVLQRSGHLPGPFTP